MMFLDIGSFHRKFELRYEGEPRRLDPEMAAFRVLFMKEELQEYIKATAENDLEGQFDALIDLVYVALGTAYLHGFPWDDGWNEVHSANMRKIRVERKEESKRGSKYDVVKPQGWRGPDIKRVLENHAARWAAIRNAEKDHRGSEGFDESD